MDNPSWRNNRDKDREELERFLKEEDEKHMPFDRKDFEDAAKLIRQKGKARILEVV